MARSSNRVIFLLILALASCASLACAASPPTIDVRDDNGALEVVVRNVDVKRLNTSDWTSQRWQSLLRVIVDSGNNDAQPPILGSYEAAVDEIRFRPRYAFRPGIAYRVTFDPGVFSARGERVAPLVHRFTVPREDSSPTAAVRAVYPSADVLPENLLKFYIQFASPMRQGVAYEHVRLLRADGTVVKDSFVDVGQELWDRTGTRLTLLFDPGRVKQGIRPHEELGRVLIPGQEYVLDIAAGWKNAPGQPLVQRYQKRFSVGSYDGTPPDPNQWAIQPPATGSKKPLSIEFNEPMDYALAQHSIDVLTGDGKAVSGSVEVIAGERQWQFTPDQPWASGAYALRIDGRFEDIAAHSVGRPFEVAIRADGTTPIAKEFVTLEFVVH